MKQKLRNGIISTIPTSTSRYSVSEICEIIAVCRKSGVVNLEIEGLSLDFSADGTPSGLPHQKLTKKQAATAKANAEAALRANEHRTRMDQLAELRLSDPLAYEELIARGELEHAGEKSE